MLYHESKDECRRSVKGMVHVCMYGFTTGKITSVASMLDTLLLYETKAKWFAVISTWANWLPTVVWPRILIHIINAVQEEQFK